MKTYFTLDESKDGDNVHVLGKGKVDCFEKMAELIDITKTVEVYKNLHRGCWSVRQDGIVRFHTDYITLKLAKFVVGQKGREKVLTEKKKNVHAYVRGFLCRSVEIDNNLDGSESWEGITYNPYKGDSFVKKIGNEKIKSADFVDMYVEDGSPLEPVIAVNV